MGHTMEIRRIVRSGNSWAINFPRKLLASGGLTLGDHAIIRVTRHGLSISKMPVIDDEPNDRTFGSYRRTRF